MLVHTEKINLARIQLFDLANNYNIFLARVSFSFTFWHRRTFYPFTKCNNTFKTIWMLITIHAFGPVKELHLPLPAIKILKTMSKKWLKDFTKLLKTFSPTDLLLSLKTLAKTFLDYIYPSSHHARAEEIFIKRDSFGRRFWHLLLFWWFRCYATNLHEPFTDVSLEHNLTYKRLDNFLP